ncbi:hypothetical protein MTR_3g085100 [Medicago truncatula]|uniref:Uncharacterized protein n=1 Tax=Medicago truncatula TaxID=3880 RepID=G7JBF6_MEDTR|nr:hypothetical protein MTR_3g085100 [Medicago truncatula]
MFLRGWEEGGSVERPTSSDGWQWLLDPIGGYPQISPSKNLHQVSWSCIYPVQGDLCFASSMWNISCRYTSRILLENKCEE